MAEETCLNSFDTLPSGYDSGALSDFQVPESSAHPWTYSLSSRTAPRWLNKVLKEVDALRYLERNWDSYGAPRVNRPSLVEAAGLLRELARPRTPAPSVVPTSDGSVQLEWHTRGIDLEVRWISPTTVHVCLEDLRGVLAPIDDDLRYDFLPLRAAIRELSSRG
jgi:hypothetical protein